MFIIFLDSIFHFSHHFYMMDKTRKGAPAAGKSPSFDQSRFFQDLFETSPFGVVCQIASGEIVAGNPAAERILGLTLDQMQGRTSSDPRWRAIHEDGSPFPGESHPSMIALREVHHRVNNNLQIISSLLRLQAERQPDAGYRKLVRANKSRIRSLGLIHEKLYASSDLSRVDLAEYAESLAAYLYQFHGVDSRRIAFHVVRAPITLDLQTAIPIGLILNELIENSLRHAFPVNREGTIRLGLGALPEGAFEMIVADDGRGIPDGIDLLDTETLGWTLIKLLTEQIGGRIETETARGLSVRIVFKEVEYQKRF